MPTSTNSLSKNVTKAEAKSGSSLKKSLRASASVPFGINFEEMCLSEAEMAATNTTAQSDNDSSTYRRETEDGDG